MTHFLISRYPINLILSVELKKKTRLKNSGTPLFIEIRVLGRFIIEIIRQFIQK
jgi:hypothetical protein